MEVLEVWCWKSLEEEEVGGEEQGRGQVLEGRGLGRERETELRQVRI